VRFLKLAAVLVCFTMVFPACRTQREADKIAWEDLAAISKASLHPKGAQPGDAPVSWRFWWMAEELYLAGGRAAYQSDVFRPLHCTPETEIEARFPDAPTLEMQKIRKEPTVDGKEQCERIFINNVIAGYVVQNQLWSRNTLKDAVAQKNGLNLPSTNPFSRQIKTEWRRIEDAQSNRYITAANDDGDLYGLVAVHMMSHELPTWLWASWMHEDYARWMPPEIGFHDSFGRKQDGTATHALKAVLSANGAEVLSHYKLIGTQTGFEDPRHLGNPLIEGTHAQNLSEALLNSSCITCHRYAAVDKTGGRPHPRRQTGFATVPDPYYSVDFSFSLAGRPQCVTGPCNEALLAAQ